MKTKKHLLKVVLFLCLFLIMIPMVTINASAKVGDACKYCGHKPFLADPYDKYGKCEECKKDYDYQPSKKSVSGIFVTNKEVQPSTTPYAETKVDFTIPKGEVVTTVASYTNAKGHLWYEVRYGDNKTGYIYGENIDLAVKEGNIYSVSGSVSVYMPITSKTFIYRSAPSGNGRKLGEWSNDELEVSKLVKDTNGDWWYYGYSSLSSKYVWVKCVATMDIDYSSYNIETNSIIKGSDLPSSVTNTSRELNYEIKTSKAKISQVSAAIYSGSNTNGTLIMGGGLYTVNATSTNIKSNAGKDIYFQKLTPGKQYTLQISVNLIGDKYYQNGAVKDYTYTVSKSWTFTVTCSHSYSSSYTTDSSNHWKVCTLCGAVGSKGAHSFSDTYDNSQHWKKCNTCGYTTAKKSHSFSTEYSATQHWQKCSCGYTKSATSHSMSASYTYDSNNHWKKCSGCGYTASKSSHSLSTDYNSNQHWSYCSCGYTTSKASHTLTNKSDSSYHWQECSCGYATSKTSHTLTNKSDSSYHWQECSCGYATTKVTHSLTMDKDSSYHWQICVCGYTTAKTAHTFTQHQDQTGTWNECTACQYKVLACVHDGAVVYQTANDSQHLLICQKCNYVLESAPHKIEISVSETAHQMICGLCEYKQLPEPHSLTQYFNESKHWADCSCGYTTGDVDHTLVMDHDYKQHWKNCNECNYRSDAVDHSFGAWEIIETAEEGKDGLKAHTCVDCDYTETESFSIAEHVHVYESYVTPPSCTENGYTTHVCACGDSYIDEKTDLLDHVSDGVWLHDENNHWNTCSECKQVINLSAHEKSQWIIDLKAGVLVEGKKHIECLVCKIVLENATIEPTSPAPQEDNERSFEEYLDFILTHIAEFFDAILNKIFSSEDIHFFREHKYVAGIIAGVAVLLVIKLIFGTKRKRR